MSTGQYPSRTLHCRVLEFIHCRRSHRGLCRGRLGAEGRQGTVWRRAESQHCWQWPGHGNNEVSFRRWGGIYTVEHYSAIRKDEIPPLATTWMDLENITLSTISQTEKVRTIWSGTWDTKVKAKKEQTRQTNSQTQKTVRWLPERRGWEAVKDKRAQIPGDKRRSDTQW